MPGRPVCTGVCRMRDPVTFSADRGLLAAAGGEEILMGYGFGGFLLVVGLVLALAVTDRVSDVDLTMVGWIMALVGGLLIVLTAATRAAAALGRWPPRPTATAPRPSASGVPRSEVPGESRWLTTAPMARGI